MSGNSQIIDKELLTYLLRGSYGSAFSEKSGSLTTVNGIVVLPARRTGETEEDVTDSVHPVYRPHLTGVFTLTFQPSRVVKLPGTGYTGTTKDREHLVGSTGRPEDTGSSPVPLLPCDRHWSGTTRGGVTSGPSPRPSRGEVQEKTGCSCGSTGQSGSGPRVFPGKRGSEVVE